VTKDFFLNKSKRSAPNHILPSVKTNLHALNPEKDVMVWFGHSSYFLQIDGKKILVDPVFSGSASPVKFTTKSFKGSDVYTADDIPVIDYLFITHDHWDHMDYETIIKLKPKIKKIITGLGSGAHLEHWGVDKEIIIEKDWNEQVFLDPGFIVNTTSSRHFSGRGFKRNGALWMSFVLTTPGMKIFLGGDSGYDKHFAEIGNKYGPFDLVILECGQYNEYWKYIHMMPEEVVQAALDLKAKVLLPVHWSKFSLSLHAWDDPIIRVTKESKRKNLHAITPAIGEEVDLKIHGRYVNWWEKVELKNIS
jgi:L-ascorbate metabolism protein UlaG (beta-lactamase superfamily)